MVKCFCKRNVTHIYSVNIFSIHIFDKYKEDIIKIKNQDKKFIGTAF